MSFQNKCPFFSTSFNLPLTKKSKMEKLNVTIASKISAEIKAEFLAIVKKSNVTKSEFIRELVTEAVKKNLQNA